VEHALEHYVPNDCVLTPSRRLLVLNGPNMGGTLKITVDGENGNVTSLLLEGPTEITKIYDLDI